MFGLLVNKDTVPKSVRKLKIGQLNHTLIPFLI